MQIDLALGQCYENLAQPDRQAEAYRRVLDVQPDQPLARLGHSRAIMALGKRKEGLAELEKVDRELRARKIDAPQVRANLLQARVSEQLQKSAEERKWDEVDALVQEMLDDENMDDLKKGLLRVEMCSMKGDLDGAKALVTPLLEEHPKEVRAWLAWYGIQERLAAKSRTTKEKKTSEEQLQALHDAVDEALGRVAEAEKAAGDQAAFRVLRAAAVARLGGDEAKQKLAALEEGIDQFTPEEQVTIWEGLGNAYQRLRDYENVRRCYQKLVDHNPNDLFPWENMFDVATMYADDKGAAEAASQIKRVSGGAGSASYKYCLASQLIGKVIAAVSQKKVEPAREKERLDEARKLVDEIRRVRPDWHQTYRLEGEIDDLEGHFDAAIANYQRALELGSTNANTARRVVILLFQQNRMSEVQTALKHVGRDSSNPMLERINVESKFRSGDREAALEMAKESVAALPDESPAQDAASAHVWYGKLLESDNHFDEAEKEYRAALEKQPESANLWMLLISNLATASKSAEKEGKKDEAAAKKAEAAEAITKAKESVPEKDKPSLLAQSYEAIDELDQAEECLLSVLKDNPGNLNVPRNIAAFYLRHGMTDKAREQIETILASKQDDSLAAANRARRAVLWLRSWRATEIQPTFKRPSNWSSKTTPRASKPCPMCGLLPEFSRIDPIPSRATRPFSCTNDWLISRQSMCRNACCWRCSTTERASGRKRATRSTRSWVECPRTLWCLPIGFKCYSSMTRCRISTNGWRSSKRPRRRAIRPFSSSFAGWPNRRKPKRRPTMSRVLCPIWLNRPSR